jgi:RHS repeat-associated protein
MNDDIVVLRKPEPMHATLRAVALALALCIVCVAEASAAELAATPTEYRFEYDASGKMTKIVDPLSQATDLRYDSLGRLSQQIAPAPGPNVARSTITNTYSINDYLIAVTDPRGLTTRYTVDVTGATLKQVSPDTGATGMTYDLAGNLKTKLDARGKQSTYTYDALHRVTAIGFSSGPGVTFEYDGSGLDKLAAGRLTKMTDESGSTAFTYGAFGEMASKKQTVVSTSGTRSLALSYVYGNRGSSNAKVTRLVYPSGTQVNFGHDVAGRVNRIWISSQSTSADVLTEIGYAPTGMVSGWKWGNSTTTKPSAYTRRFDMQGRVESYSLGDPKTTGLTRALRYDAAGRITAFVHKSDNPATKATSFDQSFEYDAMDRLIRFSASDTVQAYQYDSNGNRTRSTFGANSYTSLIDAGSNRLTSRSGPVRPSENRYDAAGNLLSDGTTTHVYSDRGRLVRSTVGTITATQLYNGLGQRVYRKLDALKNAGATMFFYDEYGKLVGEYDAVSGAPVREIVYLDDLPVAVLVPAGTTTKVNLFYIYPDHLGTPRLIERSSDRAIVWRWDGGDPFGMMPPNDNPGRQGIFTFNLRMPGQYFDMDTNLSYNYFRDYDPSSGRYVQSDPIGLHGGLNTYSYVGGNPLNYVDPRGLARIIKPEFQTFGEARAWGRKFGDLISTNNFMRERIKQLCPKLLSKFDQWSIYPDPNIDSPAKRATASYATTSYSSQSTRFNFAFFNLEPGDPSHESIFAHEFRHIMNENHLLSRPGDLMLAPERAAIEIDANNWADNFWGGKCAC